MRTGDRETALGGGEGQHAEAQMLPLLFNGCYGWLHMPTTPVKDVCGVVLCNPFGQEAIMAHRGWRFLATEFAANGMPALRFDYHGTGDSDGLETDPDRLQTWVCGIVAAVRELRGRTGVSRVALCGIRMGTLLATLATQAMDPDAIEALVLMAPVVSGREHLREQRILQQTARASPADQLDPVETDTFVTVVGNRLYRDTIDKICDCDLGKHGTLRQRPAARMLLLSTAPHNGATRLAKAAGAFGCAVQQQPFDEFENFITYPELNDLPLQSFRNVTAWLAGISPDSVRMPASADVQPMPLNSAPVLYGADFVERRMHFGTSGLFGILCEPADSNARNFPVVLIINTGAGHHVGDARTGVLCARELSRQGVASMRMDLSGIGDGAVLALPRYSFQPYASTLRRDVAFTAAWLRSQGFSRVVLFGVCSGAYHALHTATECEHVAGAVLVNVQRFIWPEGLGIQDAGQQHPNARGAATRVYLAAAFDMQKWERVLKGQTKLGSIIRELGRRAVVRLRTRLVGAAAFVLRTDTPVRQGRALLHRLDARRVPVWLVYGGFDPGLDDLSTTFGNCGRMVKRYRHIRLLISDQVDHALRSYAARDAAFSMLSEYLRNHFREDARGTVRCRSGTSPWRATPSETPGTFDQSTNSRRT